jgi:alpha-1,6-mannosyltransferase
MTTRPLTICDLSPLYCDKGGGIRTFHRARIDWFSRQARHRYVLISPGPSFAMVPIGRRVLDVRVYGMPMTRDPARYRLPLDYRAVASVVDLLQPDIVESHDAWMSIPFMWWLRRRGDFRGILTSFCHADPIATYVEPLLRRWHVPHGMAARIAAGGARLLTDAHGVCDSTFVASEWMRRRLIDSGVPRVVNVGFGVDPELLAMRRSRATRRIIRLLYVGRLDDDKEFGMILAVLPGLLCRPNVRVTVIGTGKYRRRLAALAHPRLRTPGFLSDRAALHAAYATHDVLLAPGRFESFGLSTLEAAACGLIIVGPNVGGTAELLRQMASPLMFPAGDTAGFASAIDVALNGEWRHLAERARTVARYYGSWDDAVARHVAVYEAMAGGDVEARRCTA